MRPFLYLLLLLGTFFSNAQINLNSSLTACYALNGNANDPVSNLNGTLSSVTSTVDRFNNAGSAYAFNGTAASRIELPNNSLLKSNQVSFSCWVKFNTVASSQIVVFAHNGCVSYHEGYSFGMANLGGSTTRIQIAKSTNACSAGTQIILNGSSSILASTWYHIGFYAGPDSLKLYLNGNLDASLANNNALFYSPSALVYLGGTNLGVNIPLNGSLDNARFYNRKLTGSEFQQLYLLDPACLAVPSGSVPSVAFTVSSVSLCAGNTVSLSDQSTNNPTAWNWQTPGAITPSTSLQNPVVTYSTPGTYVVSLVSSNTVGASNTATQSIVVLPNPLVTISGPQNVCSGQPVTLIAGGANTYSWSTAQTGPSIIVNTGMGGFYSVSGTDLNGCVGTAGFNLIVNPSPVVFISASPTLICQGQSLSLNASGANTYTWNTLQTGNSIVVTPAANTIYQVTGTDANNCSGTSSLAIGVQPLPAVMASANKTIVCRGNPVILSATGAQTYVWNSSLNGSTVQVNPTFNSSYTVVGTASTGCSAQSVINITVSECVGLKESVAAGEVRIYPNPVIDVMKIDLSSLNFTELKLIDALGAVIMRQTLHGLSETSLDISHTKAGIYFLVLSNEIGSTVVKITKLP
ncbi:MAG: T9SS type A sorting domain-containing protein [Bacteroidia bacterium]|nr:T9SS type A sorting domain-containing protein [Bacteroidia bacterium]